MDMRLELPKRKLEKRFEDGISSFEFRLDVSPTASKAAKRMTLEQAFEKRFETVFRQHLKRGMLACNSKVEFEIHTFDTYYDFRLWSAHHNALRKIIEKAGMKGPGINAWHVSDDECFVIVRCSFRNVSPLELYRTSDSDD